MRKISVLLLALASALVVAPMTQVKADAAEKQTVFMEEAFEVDQLSTSKWNMDTAATSMNIASQEDSGHIRIPYHVEQYHLTTKEKLVNLQSFQFDFIPNSGWTAIYFTPSFDDYWQPNGNAWFEQYEDENGDLIDWNGVWKPDIVLRNEADQGIRGWGTCSVDQSYAFENDTWYTILFEVVDENTAYLYCAPQGTNPKLGSFVEVKKKTNDSSIPAQALDYDFRNMYVEIAAMTSELRIDNLIITSDNVNIEEKFNDPVLDSAIQEFKQSAELEAEIVKANSYLTIDNATKGDSLIYKTPIVKDASKLASLEVMDVAFNVSFENAMNDELAFAFGISAETQNYTDGCYAIRMDKDGISLAKYVKNWMNLSEKIPVALDDNMPLEIVVNKDGHITVSAKGVVVAEFNVSAEDFYAGHFGFVATKDNSGSIFIDSVKALTTTYQMPVSKSVSHNFSNDFFGNIGHEDFVMNSVGGTQTVKDGKLVWEGISDFSYFGSAYQYDDFVLDVTIANIYTKNQHGDHTSTAQEAWLGIDVGKALNTETRYGTNVTLILRITPDGNAASFSPYSADNGVTAAQVANGWVKHQDIPASYFRAIQYNGEDKVKDDVSESDAVCLRFVAENNTIRFYLKKASEAEYTLYYTINNVETMGYTALCCSNFMYMEFDDFAMSNISGLYTSPDPFKPEEIIVVDKEIIYDRGNVDVNALEEALLNMDSAKLQELLAGMDDETVKQILENAGITADSVDTSEEKDGCGSQINAVYAAVPVLLAGGFLLYKQMKRREEK